MKKTTLMQLWKLNKKTNTPFLGTMDMIETLPFLSIYKDNYARFDKDFVRTRGCFAPTWNRDIEDNDIDVLNNFKEDVDNLLFRNSLSYQRMYDALIAEYSPIENFDRYEEYSDEGTVKNTTTNDYGESMEHFNYGKASETYNYGKVNITDVNGEAQQTNVLGAIKQVDKIGEQTQNTAYGEHTDSTSVGGITTSNTHRVAGYNGGLTDSESDNGNTSAHTDSTTYGAHNDSVTNKAYQNETNKDAVTNTITDAEHTINHTEDAKSDMHSTEAKSDTHSTEAKTDTSKLDGTNSNKHRGHLHGNIGVTTNQQMIESEIQLRSSYSIYLIIYNDIIRELCILEDDGIDAFTAGLDLGDDSDMEINVGNVSLKVVQTSDGVEIIAKDDTGTTTGKITNGTNGKDGVTPKFKVETDGDIYVDYSGNNEV